MTIRSTDSAGQPPDKLSAAVSARRCSRAQAIGAMLFAAAASGAIKAGCRIGNAVVLWYAYGAERVAREHLRVVAWHQHLLVSNGDDLRALLWLHDGTIMLASFTIVLALGACFWLLPRDFLFRSRPVCRPERRFPVLAALAFFGTAIPLMIFTSSLWPHLVVLAVGVTAAWRLFRGDARVGEESTKASAGLDD